MSQWWPVLEASIGFHCAYMMGVAPRADTHHTGGFSGRQLTRKGRQSWPATFLTYCLLIMKPENDVYPRIISLQIPRWLTMMQIYLVLHEVSAVPRCCHFMHWVTAVFGHSGMNPKQVKITSVIRYLFKI